MNNQEFLSLNNGVRMPTLGLGVFRAQENEATKSVETALSNGYRLIDTAAIYENEKQVGKGIINSGVSRENLFITTKLWITDYGYDSTLRAFDQSLHKLGLEYLDLYLLHWPVPSDFEKTLESWSVMEQLLAQERVKAIGVCNFTAAHIERLMEHSDVLPAVNQIELHPYFNQQRLNAFDTVHGIVTQAWSPIGGALIYHPEDRSFPHLLENQVITSLAARYNKTAAQIVIRWHLQKGRSVIPKSVHELRIIENVEVFDFRLNDEDVTAIDKLDMGLRVGPDPDEYDLNYIQKQNR